MRNMKLIKTDHAENVTELTDGAMLSELNDIFRHNPAALDSIVPGFEFQTAAARYEVAEYAQTKTCATCIGLDAQTGLCVGVPKEPTDFCEDYIVTP